MTYTVLALIFRKPSITPDQFRTHYDTVHVPLLKSLVGDTFPMTHTRNYITRTSSASPPSSPPTTTPATHPAASLQPSSLPPLAEEKSKKPSNDEKNSNSTNDVWLPALLRGHPSDFPYDSLTVMVWEDQASFDSFREVFYRKDVHDAILADEESFIDQRFKIACVLEDPVVTARDGGRG